MADEKEIQSIKVAAGKRTYFIDVKQTREESKYLNISESKRLDDGTYERHQIMVFEEDVHNVIEALQASLIHFPIQKEEKTQSTIEQQNEKHSNANEPWTEDDDNKLTDFFCQGKKPTELSKIFQRNVGAITSRIKKLELKQKYG